MHGNDLPTPAFAVLQHAGSEPLLDEPHDTPVRDTVLDEADEPFVVQRIEERTDVRVERASSA
jgi:hypothetical protein